MAHEFLPGHRIRLTVLPSFYPLYAPNPHAELYTLANEPLVAEIELRHGPQTPALLELPLVQD